MPTLLNNNKTTPINIQSTQLPVRRDGDEATTDETSDTDGHGTVRVRDDAVDVDAS